MAKFHFFTDIDRLGSQSATDAFGPVSSSPDTKFRVTSLHQPTSGSTPNAYAVCDGRLLVQDAGNNLVNLILKPNEQPPFSFPEIKFFIYRGVQKSSLVNGNDVAPSANNDLTKSIWESQQKKNASAGSSDNPPIQALGIDISGNGSIDEVFYRENVSYQLPLVRSGWSLGEFDSSQFGFELMVGAIGFDPALPIVRTAGNIITVTALPAQPTQAQEFEYWHDKEAILNYIDPCAFFGGFYARKLKVKYADGSVSKKNKNEIYDDVLKGAHLTAATDGVFFNRNRTYLDIRNEYNHSINYFKNYGTYSNTDINCAFDVDDSLTTRNYYASTWPLMIIDKGDLPATNASKRNLIRLALPDGAGDNPCPTLYLSAGYSNDSYPREPKDKAKLINLNVSSGFTDEVALATPNRDGQSSTTAISSYIKLKYFKRFDPDATTPPVSSGTVIRASNYLDNLFAPFAMKIPFAGTAKLKSVVYDDEFFVDAESLTGVFSSAKYEDHKSYSFLRLPKVILDIVPSQVLNLAGIKSDIYGSYLEHLSSDWEDFEIKKSFLSINQQEIDYLLAKDFSLSEEDATNQRLDKVISLSIPISVLQTSVVSLFHPKARVYLALKNRQELMDDFGQPFEGFELFARGFVLVNDQIQVDEIALNVNVRLKDNTYA